MVNDTYDLIIRESQNKDEKTGNNPCPLDPMQVENKKEDLAGADLANRLWVSLDVRPYLLLFGDTLIRPPFSFWWFISICSGPQAENSTLKVKKVGYYPTIDIHIFLHIFVIISSVFYVM